MIDRYAPRLSVELRLVKAKSRPDPRLRPMTHLVRPGDVTVDVGANRGAYTLHLSRLVGPTGRVHAVEPFPPNVTALDSLRKANVVVHGVALSDHAGQEPLYVPRYEGRGLDALASLTPRTGSHDEMPIDVATLDAVLGAEPGPVTLIKCDVEGHELSVLRGSDEVLRRDQPALLLKIEQRHQAPGERIDATFSHLADRGYRGYYALPDGIRPLEDFDVHRDQLSF